MNCESTKKGREKEQQQKELTAEKFEKKENRTDRTRLITSVNQNLKILDSYNNLALDLF